MRRAWISALALCSGCLSLSNFRPARTLDPRTLKVGFDIDYQRVDGDSVAAPELALHYGVAQGLELGLKLGAYNVELNGAIQLLRSEKLELALAPAFGYAYSAGVAEGGERERVWNLLSLKLPVLIGYNATPELQVVFGPTLLGVEGFQTAGAVPAPHALLLGATLGLWLHFPSRLAVMPELGVFTPLAGSSAPVEYGDVVLEPAFGRPVYLEAGVAFSIGDIHI